MGSASGVASGGGHSGIVAVGSASGVASGGDPSEGVAVASAEISSASGVGDAGAWVVVPIGVAAGRVGVTLSTRRRRRTVSLRGLTGVIEHAWRLPCRGGVYCKCEGTLVTRAVRPACEEIDPIDALV